MLFVKELDREVNHICTLLRAQTDIDIKTTSLEELSVHINNILAGSVLYQSLSQLDYKFEFMEFVKSINLELSKEKSLYLKGRLMTINHLQLHMNDIEKEHALNLAKITKPVKDEIKTYMDEICKEYSLLEHVNYKFDSNLFVIDTTKRAIKDRLRSLTGIDNFIFSSYSPVNLTAI
ncbi:DUF244 domain-containing protein (plasmid) [Borrelia miyamotoi]|nr:DUF244 domain-containing protein [Borrelia miyamotoi]QBK64077.1 DUF244 domain-containing protein [Borrelia miyamotoi]QBK65340.1 DUF244 domain-containing protein [Borrelia miyamotoi]QBK66569.1 DUF244 domain-containing protein [Borrelia miyamotoi]